jgi:hypothetical protein
MAQLNFTTVRLHVEIAEQKIVKRTPKESTPPCNNDQYQDSRADNQQSATTKETTTTRMTTMAIQSKTKARVASELTISTNNGLRHILTTILWAVVAVL